MPKLINFDSLIKDLFSRMQTAWNEKNYEEIANLMEDDVTVTIKPVSVSRISIQSQRINGKKDVMKYIKQIRSKFPLRYEAEFPKENLSKTISYRKFYYQIKVWGYFETVISEYGRYKDFKIVRYETDDANKISGFHILRNVIGFKLKTMLKRKA
jgi:hypothetical protein